MTPSPHQPSKSESQSFVLEMVPIPKARARVFVRDNGKIGSCIPAKSADAEEELRQLLNIQRPKKYEAGVPLGIDVVFSLPRGKQTPKNRVWPCVRPDFDNYVKLLDACNGILWVDDGQIVDARIRKVYGKPCIRLDVWVVTDTV